ncbi:MAG: cell envelope integrity protein TolA [Marinobacterium sp.]|uniref:Cell division and transport-associated protein TolA n=1 Tax=Marinobacterium iners DSM 11526 TaxID=1122198 RepID=A0A1H4BBW4_9GAMM|nr:cell envelope integrity protein TolA [Marinobacterium iners]SEA45630.1 Cell division and transport-associated protein TolA [Marinobacterium iners DSM 11526]
MRSYILPFMLAFVVHAAAFSLISMNWDRPAEPVRSAPRHIQAEMIDLKALAQQQAAQEQIARQQAEQKRNAEEARQRREREAVEQRQQELARKQAEADARKRAEQQAEQKRQQEQARQKAEEQKRQAELAARKKAEAEAAKRKAQEQAKREAEEAKRKAEATARAEAERRKQQQQAEADLQRKLAAERAEAQARAEQASQAVIGDIQSYIQAVLQDSWRIPSTARNGMEAVVAIHFLPSGEVDQAYIHTSSGNAQFDSSAVQAVLRAHSFPRVADVDPLLFERRLRKLLVKFRPEGLRW